MERLIAGQFTREQLRRAAHEELEHPVPLWVRWSAERLPSELQTKLETRQVG